MAFVGRAGPFKTRGPFRAIRAPFRGIGAWGRYPARTNSVRNSIGAAAVAGAPGTLPTNWVAATPIDGLSRSVVGSGTDPVTGFAYVDLNWAGTSGTAGNSTVWAPEAGNFIAAVVGQAWAASCYVSLVGGSLTNVTTLNFSIRFNNSGGSQVTAASTSILGISSSGLRPGVALTAADATTAYVNCSIVANFANSSAVDFTLRIVGPQIERGSSITSHIATSGSAASRVADLLVTVS